MRQLKNGRHARLPQGHKDSGWLVLKLDRNSKYTFNIGDYLVLKNKHGKCLVKVKVKKKSVALASSQQCNFDIKKNDELKYLNKNLFDAKMPDSEKTSGNPGTTKKDYAYFSLIYMKNPSIDFESVKLDALNVDLGDMDDEFNGCVGISLEGIWIPGVIHNGFYLGFGTDFFLRSKSNENGNNSSIRPLNTYINIGIRYPFSFPRWSGNMKLFVGLGISSLNYEIKSMSNVTSMGTIFQSGFGVIHKNLFLEFLIQQNQGEASGNLGKGYEDLSGSIVESDYSYFEPALRLGFEW